MDQLKKRDARRVQFYVWGRSGLLVERRTRLGWILSAFTTGLLDGPQNLHCSHCRSMVGEIPVD
jgi:hypothetical protein